MLITREIKNREVKRLKRARKISRRWKLRANLYWQEWFIKLDAYDWKCAFCGVGEYEAMYHLYPRTYKELGGTTYENCMPSCLACVYATHKQFIENENEGVEIPSKDEVFNTLHAEITNLTASIAYRSTPEAQLNWVLALIAEIEKHLPENEYTALLDGLHKGIESKTQRGAWDFDDPFYLPVFFSILDEPRNLT